ncbi:MAG: AraC family transcriptional regulator [Nannocystaceae bacterium]
MRPRLTAAFYGGRGFSLYHACGSASRVPLAPHFHDEYLICAQLRGDEHCHVAGKLHEFRSGDVALINPHQVHTGNTEGEDVEYISLYVDASCVQRIAAELGADARTPEFTVVRIANHAALVEEMARLLAAVQARGGTVFPTPHSDDDPELELPRRVGPPALAAALAAAAHEPGRPPDDDLSVDEALTRVVVHAFEEFSNLRTPLQRSTNRVSHRKIARALEYMRQLPPSATADAIGLDRLAEIAELSKFHFLRQFDQVVGMTPGAYVRTLRLCHAARLLRTSETPILDIASAVGFADHPSFSRAFVRAMGLTPSEYRRLGPL